MIMNHRRPTPQPQPSNPSRSAAPRTKRLTDSRCLCRGCGQYFNSTSVFDRHRAGSYGTASQPGTRRCLAMDEMAARGWLLNKAGFWITAKRPAVAATSRVETAIAENCWSTLGRGDRRSQLGNPAVLPGPRAVATVTLDPRVHR